MSDRVFLDTNIFAYTFEEADVRKAERARALVGQTILEERAVISYQVIQEFFSVAFRRFRPPMTRTEAEDYLLGSFGRLPIVAPSISLFLRAFDLVESNHLAWYDSLIVAAALEAECTILYTEDLQHGRRFGKLEIRNPFIA
jgi:predicted nucleic acid-binding protein